MALTSFVKVSELEGAKRLDAEYYRTDILDLQGTIQNSRYKVVRLKDLVKKGYRAVYWSTKLIPRQNMSSEDVFFLQATNLNDDFPTIDLKGMGGVWRKDWEDYPDGRIKQGELLIEVKGKAEKVVMVPEDFPKNTMVSGSLFKLSVEEKVEPEYVLVYLLTKFGKYFRDRLKTNLLVSFVNKGDLYNLPIVMLPSDFRERIRELYLSAYETYKESEILYSQAEMLLTKELGFDNLKLKHELTYTSSLEKTISNHRVDAEFFQPLYDSLVEHLNCHFQVKPLSELLVGLRKGIEVGNESYNQKGRLFIRVSNLSANGFTDRDQKYISEKSYQQFKTEFQPKVGDLLLTKDASLGIAYIVKEHVDGIVSSGILILNVDEAKVNREYLAFCINSLVGKMQIERDSGGSVITHLRPELIEKLLIPILPKRIQQKIAMLIQTSHSKRRKAKEMLAESIARVEKTIES